MFWATASCFRPVFEGCKINKMCEFDKSFAFQACFCRVRNLENVWIWQELRVSGLFLKGAASTKCASLARASRFRGVFGMSSNANATVASLKKCVFRQQYRVSVPLGHSKSVTKRMFWTTASCFRLVFEGCWIEKLSKFDGSLCSRHILLDSKLSKCTNLMRTSCFWRALAVCKIKQMRACDELRGRHRHIEQLKCMVCKSLALVRLLREMRGQHRHIEQLAEL